jgi:hypothetical protein
MREDASDVLFRLGLPPWVAARTEVLEWHRVVGGVGMARSSGSMGRGCIEVEYAVMGARQERVR